ncbi:MFS transporter [Nocardioides agariphilus]|uniref:MFS transporter n=1 Tax=Nocardioides agariphilus TaxID=433664 RepID=A0A930VMA0_9ACTN|nr:MFS transporter [Nocardioides agariphilus]
MTQLRDRFLRLIGPTPLVRSLAGQSVISAFGEGAFLTGSAVFFTIIVGLSAQQVGLGLSVAALVRFAVSVPLGKLVDRWGSKPTWQVTSALEAAAYAVWPLLTGWWAFVAMMVVMAVLEAGRRNARGAYGLAVFAREERVRSQAYLRAARNVGYTFGALAAGLALATDSDNVVRMVPLVTAALLAVNALWVFRLPDLVDDDTAESPIEQAVEHAGEKRSALHNRGFFLMSVCNGVLGTHGVLLNVVIPLWLVQETDAPHVLLAWLFGTNTVMAVFLQVAAARGVTDVRRSLRAQYRGAACFALSCAIVLVTHDTVGWVTIVLVWVGHVTVTGSELFQSAGMWGLVSELSDPERLGEYQGVSGLGYTMGDVWAPALYTFLAMTWGAPGWVVIAAIVLVAALGIGPSSHAAERYLERSRTPATA